MDEDHHRRPRRRGAVFSGGFSSLIWQHCLAIQRSEA